MAVARKLRLVVADDESSARLLIGTLLSFVESVDVVGEAEDGDDAVRLVGERDADLVLLDVQMPRLDGLAAAELIQALRPQTRIVLHSADADDSARQRAARLGLPLLDKMQVEQVIAALTAGTPSDRRARPDPQLESAALAALTARRAVPVLLVRVDGTVAFYNSLAAGVLGLPLPSRPLHIDALRRSYDVLDPDDRRSVPHAERPLERSFRARETISEALIVAHGEARKLCTFSSVPYFDDDGELLGAALYVEPVAEL